MLAEMTLNGIAQKIPIAPLGISVGLMIAAFFVSSIVKRMAKRGFARTANKPDSFLFQLWKQERKFILRTISGIVWLGFIGAILFVWSEYIGRLFAHLNAIYAPLLRAILVVLVAMLALKTLMMLINFLVGKFAGYAEQRNPRGRQRVMTLKHIFRYGTSILILLITVLMLLDNFGIDLKAVLATLGVASLAVGFGAQSLVKDLVSGIFTLIEDQYSVGDVVSINGNGGFVERMTLRITQLRNTEGTLITIPNGLIETVKNMTKEWSRVDYMIGVAYDTDLDRAVDVLMDEAKKLKADMPEEVIDEPERLGVDSFEDSSITLRVWIKTEPLKQWMVKRELNRRVHKRFDAEGIEIPFPQRTLWIKEPQEALLAKLVEERQGG